jgi:hypothetical protein
VQGDLTDFTPFGYLANPGHVARAWGDTVGGCLRTCADWLGVEWAYPVGRDATSRAALALEATVDGRPCRTRADFDAIGVTSRYHTCFIHGFDWQANGVGVEARFFLADDDVLCVRLTVANAATDARVVDISVVYHAEGDLPEPHVLHGPMAISEILAPRESRRVYAMLTHGAKEPETEAAEAVYARKRDEDSKFATTCPTLSGDWPAHWREGLHHDFQTTRLLVQPAGGIFKDVWPAWMAAWPRVVLAEGTLDMLRLAYADAALAQRAVLSLFRDAPEANVPCVFRGGEYNMVAADGSRCGTSPAWCLPFLNMQHLYLRTLDHDWLTQIYPLAAAYLDWWLVNRTDADGWVVYKCTWESGEDGNPRLDPNGTGDADISHRLRPVELQATMAHAASVMGFFAGQLGLETDYWRWLEVEYRERTRKMFDANEGRHRDWLIQEQRFQEPCPDAPYWGVDACRYSAQSLTPLLLGLPLDATELRRHACAPWTLWPSWTWSLVESAAAAGMYGDVGAWAYETIDRVYRITTRRAIGSFPRPLPGASPEFWPEDWRTYGGSDAYGWGATTANLLIRHVFGFKESLDTDGWVAELTPAFPLPMLRPGARYAIQRLTYRGRTFDLSFEVLPDRLLGRYDDGELRKEFDLSPGKRYTLRLR